LHSRDQRAILHQVLLLLANDWIDSSDEEVLGLIGELATTLNSWLRKHEKTA
jgi:hypothetical protein